jgi:ParB-like chromosome segregation protein Spo0J
MSKRTQHQKFVYREVHRSQINPAPYNPNVMSDYSYKLLSKKLKEVGLLTTLVWNERTGNLVGGHHRLKGLDQLEGKLDYTLGVAVVNLSEKQEKEMNVYLNNSMVQGRFDKDLFFKMLEQQPLDLDGMGMTRLDLEMEFGELPGMFKLGESLLSKQETSILGLADEAAAIIAPRDEAKQARTPTEEERQKMRAARKEYRESRANAPENDGSYYLVLRFDRVEDKNAWLESRGYPLDAPYITAQELGLVK